MQRMRWRVAIFTVMALLAAACGGDGGTAEDDTSTTEAAPDETEETTADTTEDTEAETTEDTEAEPAGDVTTGVGVTDEAIKIGLLADLTGIFASTVVPLTDGAEAYFERLNAAGGAAGRQIDYITVDTGYDVPTHQQFYDEFASTGDSGVAFIGFSTGSPHTASIRESLTDDGVGAIPLSWNSSWATDASANIFEWGTPYCVEAMNGLSWLAQENDASTVAVVSFPGDYGEDGAIGAKEAAADLGLEVVYDGQGAVVPGADQTPVITGIADANPDIVWATVNSTTLAELMGGAAQAGYTGQWGGNGPSYAPQLMDTEVGPLLDSSYTHFAPYPGLGGVDTPGMDEILAMMREQRPDAPFIGVYVISWIQGEIVRQGIETAAANGDLTRQGIIDALQSTEIDMQGVIPNLNYSGDPNDQITRSSFIFDISADAYSADATVQDDVGDGTVLVDPAYTSDTAANWEYAPCFEV